MQQSKPETDQAPTPEANVLQFDPPCAVYPVIIENDADAVVEEPLKKGDLTSRMRIAIPNPWAEEDGRYLPGIAYGDGTSFVMDVGVSFGALQFDEERGWVCTAILPKNGVMSGVIKELLENATKGTFTQRLLKRSSKGKKQKGRVKPSK